MMNKKNMVAAACFLGMCLLCCACGRQNGTILIDDVREQDSESLESAVPETESGALGQEDPPEVIRVYVCGAVAVPGVVEIPAGSRAEDALRAAGGFAEEAAPAAVNLADWVLDGQMLYFPTKEEAEEQKAQDTESTSDLVNINTAGMELLCTLPGIGESRALDIISYREANGAFASCEDIMNVPGIKSAVYEKIKDKITVK